jgi:hypothetical protein
MEPAPPRPRHEAIDHDDLPVREWRVIQKIHPDTDSFENHMRAVERSGPSYTQTLEGTTNIRISGTPSQGILEMLSQTAWSGVPMTVQPDHLGTRDVRA